MRAVSEMALDTLKSLVMDAMDKQSHPIIVSGSNICDLVKTDKIGSLKLAVLKEICQQLHLTTSGQEKRLSLRPLKHFPKVAHTLKVTLHGYDTDDQGPRTYHISLNL